jgi:hypothetical protein
MVALLLRVPVYQGVYFLISLFFYLSYSFLLSHFMLVVSELPKKGRCECCGTQPYSKLYQHYCTDKHQRAMLKFLSENQLGDFRVDDSIPE